MSPKRLLSTVTVLLATASAAAGPAAASTVDAPGKTPAVSAANDVASQWPTDGPSVQAALQIAQRTWGVPVCPQGGGFSVAWGQQADHINAMAVWSGNRDQPLGLVGCSITLNPAVGWDWPKLCTVLVHEVGHLSGQRHVEDTEDVMSSAYYRPMAACHVPDPQAKPVAVARAKVRRAATRSASSAKSAKSAKTARRAKKP